MMAKKGKGGGGFQSRNTSLLQNCIRNERSTQKNSKDVDDSILNSAKILTELPSEMQDLKNRGMSDKIPDLIALNRTAARDLDGYIAQKVDIDKRLKSHLAARPKEEALLSKHNSQTLAIGGELMELSQRLVSTVGKSTGQIIDILASDPTPAVEEPKLEEAAV